MKRLFYILTSILVLSSCTDELSVSNDYLNFKEGDDVKVQFTINAPEQGIAETRTLGDLDAEGEQQKALNVWVLVFDNTGLFKQAVKADAPERSTSKHNGHNDTNFTVTLHATSEQRIIHFIAFDGGEETALEAKILNVINDFGSEGTKIQSLYAEAGQAAYWQRVESSIEKTGELEDGTAIGVLSAYYNTETEETDCIPLVRNFAKVSVVKGNGVNNFNLEGFTIINAPSMGMVAPYKGGFVEYIDGKAQKTYQAITALGYEGSTPSGTTYSTPTITGNESSIITSDPKYLYETPNASGDAKGRTALIVKGYYNNSTTPTYYKVDLIYDADGENSEDNLLGNKFYNILRNFEYKVTINEVSGNGHSSFDEAVASAASNNLSSSTVTANLSSISDGKQKLEVTNTYFMFTTSGVKTVLKYRYSYYVEFNGTQRQIFNNDLVGFTNSNDDLFSSALVKATNDDADGEYQGWRTITMDLNSPDASQALTTNIHIYASKKLISDNNLESTINGDLLYRDVRVDLRNKFKLLVEPQSYVEGEAGTPFRVDLLIPQSVNEGLFPMDFYLEDKEKFIYPDEGVDIKLPIYLANSIVPNESNKSFQYTRTVTKDDYGKLETRSVDGVTYRVIPCYFKTNVDDSDDTEIFAFNEYFEMQLENGKGAQFSNTPVAFRDNFDLKIIDKEQTYLGDTYNTTQLYGTGYPVTLAFWVTEDAIGKSFNISVDEGTNTFEDNLIAQAVNEFTFTDGNNVSYKYYQQEYTYYTKTINGDAITPTITAAMDGDERKASLAMKRRYFVIGARSFKTNIEEEDIWGAADGSRIYIEDGVREEYLNSTYVGWFGRQVNPNTNGFLDKDGPKADYVIDREYQNYKTLEGSYKVYFRIDGAGSEPTNITATTSISELDAARNGTTTTINFVP